jgi:23S rRNA-/tRNA-specific pseudouridylate synthase
MSTLRVLYKDEDLLVIDKASGRVVEGDDESLEAQIRREFDDRARALHRLDRGTSGVLAFSLRRLHHAAFVQLWENRRVKKLYWAWVEGVWPASISRLGGKDSEGREMETTLRVLEHTSTRTLLELVPRTGRRHQLRLQCSQAGHPIVGDLRYGAASCPALGATIALHARRLEFVHPVLKTPLSLEADLPDAWLCLTEAL